MIETLVIQVTNRCPYNCPQCYMQKGNTDLPLSDAFQLIDSLLPYGLKAVQLTGGEPLAYLKLMVLIEYAHNKGLYVFMASSGYNHSVKLYESLLKSGLDILCVSINDIDKSINSLTRDTYEESFLAMREALEAGLMCFANVVVSDSNIQNFEVLSRYLKKIGVEQADILQPISSFDGKYVPSVSQQTLQLLEKIVSQDPNFFRIENCFKGYWEYTRNHDFVCRDAGNTSVFLNADGTVSPCSKLQDYRYTSIYEMMKAEKIWKEACCR